MMSVKSLVDIKESIESIHLINVGGSLHPQAEYYVSCCSFAPIDGVFEITNSAEEIAS